MSSALRKRKNPSFILAERRVLEGRHFSLEHYRHLQSGADHYHLACDSRETACVIAIPTAPTDNTGVAHVLEHLVLCGSRKYDVRAPFALMSGRTLNTYMNALTAPDWTGFAFATQGRQDFWNLLDICLDGIFFPLLRREDFLQEAWRLAYKGNDPAAELEYRGVVYNEVRGVFGEQESQLWQAMSASLYDDGPYRYTSAGLPSALPDLTYESLVAFHAKHYRPAAASFFTYGDVAIDEFHTWLGEQIFASSGPALERTSHRPVTPPFEAPRHVSAILPTRRDIAEGTESHLLITWLLGPSADREQRLLLTLVKSILLDGPAAPLRRFLENCRPGAAPSALCGLQRDLREIVFSVGLQGIAPDNAEMVEREIIDALRSIAASSELQSHAERALHRLELSLREVRGDITPYGIQLILQAVPGCIHGGHAADCLDLEGSLRNLRKLVCSAGFLGNFIEQNFLLNTRRISVVGHLSREAHERQENEDHHMLAALKAALPPDDVQQILQYEQDAGKRCADKRGQAKLPMTDPSDIEPSRGFPMPERREFGQGVQFYSYTAEVSGISAVEYVVRMPRMPSSQVEALRAYSYLATKMLELKARQRSGASGLDRLGAAKSAMLSRPVMGANAVCENYLAFYGSALDSDVGSAIPAFLQGIIDLNFMDRRDLSRRLQHYGKMLLSSIAPEGHTYVMNAAIRGLNQLASQRSASTGLIGVKQLVNLAGDSPGLEALLGQFDVIQQSFRNGQPTLFSVTGQDADDRHRAEILRSLEQHLEARHWTHHGDSISLELDEPACGNELWLLDQEVFHCAAAWPTVAHDHPDSPALSVLAKYIKDGFLFGAIRETGGAYGTGAISDPDTCTFRMYSYRDPRFLATLSDFQKAVEWMVHHGGDGDLLGRARLATICGMDKPLSPTGEARVDFHCRLFGLTPEIRNARRQRVLSVTFDELKDVAVKYLANSPPRLAVMGPAAAARRRVGDWEVHALM